MKQASHMIFGTGLTGSYLAGCFTQRKIKLTLVGRESSKHLLNQGVLVSDYLGNQYQSHQALSFINADDKQTIDFVWLTVKCTSINHVLEPLKSYISQNTTIICCQNGFGSDDIVQQAFPNNQVISGIVGFNVVHKSDNHWHRSTEGVLVVEHCDKTQNFTDTLSSALLPVRVSSDIEAERWAKLQLNLANAINALADIPVKAMTEQRHFRLIIAHLMQELLAVTQRLNLELPKVAAVHGKMLPTILKLPDFIFTRIAQKMLAIDPQARTSMWHDLHNQRPTEIDFLNGAVSEQAKKLGLESPINNAVIRLIKSIEQGEQTIGFSAKELQYKLGL